MDLWTYGLICAFEYVRGRRKVYKSKHSSKLQALPLDEQYVNRKCMYRAADTSAENGIYGKRSPSLMDMEPDQDSPMDEHLCSHNNPPDQFSDSRWVPIGWARISELVQTIQSDAGWSSQQLDFIAEEEDVTVAELAAPYWERPGGPLWWCHLDASKPHIISWLTSAQWLHPAISVALRDESRLISEHMKYLFYEVPVRIAGGLLSELLGQSAGDPLVDEDDIPIVLRSWQAQNFLMTVMHMKGSASNLNVLGLTEVQELFIAGGYTALRTIHEVIAHLASRLARWDDRLFRKSIFGVADEVELKFVNRRNHEDLNLFAIILNQEIRKLSRQVIRVKWSLHAREEIMFELLQHLRGNATRNLLEGIRKSTREMLEEQEAVRGRLFTIQDVMQSTVRAWLQLTSFAQPGCLWWVWTHTIHHNGTLRDQCRWNPWFPQHALSLWPICSSVVRNWDDSDWSGITLPWIKATGLGRGGRGEEAGVRRVSEDVPARGRDSRSGAQNRFASCCSKRWRPFPT